MASDLIDVREATAADWDQIWGFMREIIAAGETYSWDTQMTENEARAIWMREPPHRTLVAIDSDGRVVATTQVGPNHGGPGSHVATAGFMVDPTYSGRGVGRTLGEHVIAQARADGYRAIQFNAVVETNTRAVGLWRSLGFEVLTTVPEAFHHPRDGYVGLNIMYLPL